MRAPKVLDLTSVQLRDQAKLLVAFGEKSKDILSRKSYFYYILLYSFFVKNLAGLPSAQTM